MNIECVKTGYLEENCYILTIDDKCLIIDPGDDFIKIKEKVGSKKVLKVLVTHYHFDHIGALDDVKKCYNVDVIDNKSLHIQSIGPFNFEIIDTKGHKDDSVTYYFKDYKIMFVGDFIFEGSIGRCDMPGGNIIDMKESINKIKKYDKDIILYPGHGNRTSILNELKNNIYFKGDFNE